MLQNLISITSIHPYITFLSTLLLFLLLYVLYRTQLDSLSSIPGPIFPRLTPLWLYTHSYLGTESRAIHALHRYYGPIVRISPNDISISDPAALHRIYTAKGGFLKAPCYANFDIDGHPSIFSALDPKHRAPRAKAVVGLFALSVIRENAIETIETCAEEFIERIKESREVKGRVDVLQMARSLALDAVTGYLFGQRYGGLEERKKQSSSVKDVGLSAGGFVDAFVAVGRFFLLPNNLFILLDKLSTILFPDAAIDASMATVDAYVADVVRSSRATLEDPNAQDTYQRRLLLAGFSESETKAQCKDLIFAGTDSTGMNIATACWHLAKNQDLLQTIYHELNTTTPSASIPINPTTHPHLHSFLEETLRISMANPTRLLRIVPFGGTELLGYHIPAGTTVGCSSYSLHFDAAIFKEPFEFKPKRWIGEVDTAHGDKGLEFGDTKEQDNKNRSTNISKMHASLLPFGHGPRQCIARNLATTELEIVLRKVIESGCLVGAKPEGNSIEIMEWFNSSVVGGSVWIS